MGRRFQKLTQGVVDAVLCPIANDDSFAYFPGSPGQRGDAHNSQSVPGTKGRR